MARFDQGNWFDYPIEDSTANAIACGVGESWVATSKGVYRINGLDPLRFTTEDGLPSDAVRAVAIAKNEDVWLATDKGLAVIRKRR